MPQPDRRDASRKILENRLGKAIHKDKAEELSHGVKDVRTTMVYTHVLNRGPSGVRSPIDLIEGAYADRHKTPEHGQCIDGML